MIAAIRHWFFKQRAKRKIDRLWNVPTGSMYSIEHTHDRYQNDAAAHMRLEARFTARKNTG